MKKLLLVSFVMLSSCHVGAASKSNDAATPCPEQNGYGKQSTLAVCADYINAGCNRIADACVEGFSVYDCLSGGMTYCIDFENVGGTIDQTLFYTSCLQDMQTVECENLMTGNVPQSCVSSMKKGN